MSTSNISNKNGIDVRLALDILADRTQSSPPSYEESKTVANRGCNCHQHATPEGATMGQVIDLESSSSLPPHDTSSSATKSEDQKMPMAKKRVAIRSELASMTTKDLLRAVVKVQEQRVATYRNYDSGLETVLQTGNMTNYPTICAEATASFAVLSDTLNIIHEIFADEKKEKSFAKLVYNLQQSEKNKLQLTAALHLERLRLSQHQQQQQQQDSSDSRISNLLEGGLKSLKEKLVVCVEDINETLDEIRYSAMDEE